MDTLDALRNRHLVQLAEGLCHLRGITMVELCGTRRSKAVVRARHELWWTMRTQKGYSYPEIGGIFGRDHTTVLSGVRAHAARREEERASIEAGLGATP